VNLVQRITLALAKRSGAVKPARRAFNAAQVTNLTSSWLTTPAHVNSDLQRGLRALRARSRDLSNNNDYARKFLSMVETNVVGHAGFAYQIKPPRPDGTVDELDRTALENAFWDWSRPGNCEVTGRLSLTQVERLFIRTVARDGEVLVRKVPGGKYGFMLQLVDPQQLDEGYNADLSSGNKIRMGVEYNMDGAAVAYHLSVQDTADPQLGEVIRRRVRVSANDIRLFFIPEMIGQLRGTPWMVAGMLRLNMLGAYEEAEVTASRIAAAKMGFFTQSETGESYIGDSVDAAGNQITSAEPGTFETLPAGVDFKSFDPQHPTTQYSGFVKACLRGLSSGLGVSYHTLANDLEGVNYSSIRAGVLEEREVWKGIQNWMVEQLLDWVYSEWLRNALTMGQVVSATGVSLPASRYDKFNAITWQGRRWDWVDPEKDMNAAILAISHGLKSRTEVVSEQGRDIAQVWDDLVREQNEAERLGVRIEDLDAAVVAPAPAETDESESTNDRQSITVNPAVVTVHNEQSDVDDVIKRHLEPVVAVTATIATTLAVLAEQISQEQTARLESETEQRRLRELHEIERKKEAAAREAAEVRRLADLEEQNRQHQERMALVRMEASRPREISIPRANGKPLIALVRSK
jgi:lambda family phage portal protein